MLDAFFTLFTASQYLLACSGEKIFQITIEFVGIILTLETYRLLINVCWSDIMDADMVIWAGKINES